MSEIVFGIRLKADGSGMVGEVRASAEELEKLAGSTRRASEANERQSRTSDAMTRGMSESNIAARRLSEGMSQAGRQAMAQSAAQEKLAGSSFMLTRALGVVAAAYAAVRLAMSSVDEYRAQEQAVAKLDTTIASLHRTTTNLSGRLQMLASQMQRDGIIGDEAIVEGASFLAMYEKITDDLLPRTVRIMTDLAAKTGGDVTTAARAMGMAAEGSTDLLRRQGIIISETARESGDFALILDEVERAVGGTNIALGETATGGMTQAKNAAGELLEELGRLSANIGGSSGLNDTIKDGAGFWQSQVAQMNAAIEAGENWLVVVSKMIATGWWRGSPVTAPIMNLVDKGAAIDAGNDAWAASEAGIAAHNRFRAPVTGFISGEDGLSVGAPKLDEFLEYNEAIRQYNSELEKQLALQRDNSAVAQARWAIEHSDMQYASALDKERAISLAEQIDLQVAAAEAAKLRAKEEADLIAFVMEASDQAAARQRKEMDDRDRLMQERVERLRQALMSEEELEDERYRNSIAMLDQAEREKMDSTMSYVEMRQRLEEDHQRALTEIRDKANIEQTRREEEAARARAEMMMEPFKNAIRGVQSTFSNFFQDVFSGGVDSFKDLATSIKNIFIRLAAEIAALLVFRPVMAGILSSVGLSAAASQLGLTGGGGFSLPGIPGMGNLFSGAGNWLNSIGGMLGFGAPQAASSVALQGGSFFGSAAGGNVAGMAPGSLTGASLTGVLGAASLGFMGGGIFADMLGLNSGNGSIGGGIGAGIGMAVGGPVGGLVGGALGSVLGGLFGNDKDYPFTNAQILVGANGVARVGKIQTLDGGDQAAARALAEAAVAQFNAMAEAQNYTFDKGFSFYVGSNTDRGSSDNLGTGFYAGSYGGFEGGASTTGLQSADQAVAAAVQYGLSQGKAGAAPAQTQFKDQLRDMLDVMRAGVPALTQLQQQFRALRDQARELGGGMNLVRQAYREHLKDLRGDIRDQIRGLLDSAYQTLNISGLTQFRDSLSYSGLSPGSPIDRFNSARGLFNQTAASALAGDNAAAQLFPQLAQELLTLGRDVYASGPQYAELFTDVNRTLNQVIANQQSIYQDLAASVSVSIRETSQDQIAVIRDQTERLEDALLEIRRELRSARAGG